MSRFGAPRAHSVVVLDRTVVVKVRRDGSPNRGWAARIAWKGGTPGCPW